MSDPIEGILWRVGCMYMYERETDITHTQWVCTCMSIHLCWVGLNRNKYFCWPCHSALTWVNVAVPRILYHSAQWYPVQVKSGYEYTYPSHLAVKDGYESTYLNQWPSVSIYTSWSQYWVHALMSVMTSHQNTCHAQRTSIWLLHTSHVGLYSVIRIACSVGSCCCVHL